MINNKQRFSQRLISMMYNVKNFLTKLINVFIGKGTLIYLSIIILIFSISIFLYANIRSNNESFYYATLAIGLISSLLLMFFCGGKNSDANHDIHNEEKRKKLGYICLYYNLCNYCNHTFVMCKFVYSK